MFMVFGEVFIYRFVFTFQIKGLIFFFGFGAESKGILLW